MDIKRELVARELPIDGPKALTIQRLAQAMYFEKKKSQKKEDMYATAAMVCSAIAKHHFPSETL